ncbi:MAG TPA: GAF domain-containing protein [Chloroflexi bacterium]|nr:GAF domain-containing protein [Chloroflexota bacterium]
MSRWTWPAVFSGTLSLLILIYAYLSLWRYTRQPSMRLWGLGWMAYTVHFVLNHMLGLAASPPFWRYVSLVALGESGFLLLAGTYAFTSRPFRPRTYAWAAFPALWALVVFLPPAAGLQLALVPIFLFSGLADLLTALRLATHVHSLREGQFVRGIGIAYGAWAGVKIASPFIPLGSPASLIAVLLTDALALGMAFGLIGLSLVDADRSAKRRAERLNALATLTAAAGHLVTTDELLKTAIDELARLLEVREGVAIFLYPTEAGAGLPRQAIGKGAPDVCREGILHEDCICMEAIRTRGTIYRKVPAPPSPPCPEDCPLNLAVPMVARGRVVGAICAALPQQVPFTEGERHTLETIARQLGLAIENSRLAEERVREIDRLQALTTASRWMALGLELKRALRGLAGVGSRIVGADRVVILVRNRREDRFEVGYARGLSQEYLDYLMSVLERTPDYRAVRTLQEVYVEDAWHDPRAEILWEAARREGFRSYLVLPLVRHHRAIGTLAFYHDQFRTYDPEERRICQALADQAAAVVENNLLHQETQRQVQALSVLHEIETHIASSLNLEDLLEAVGKEIQRLLRVSTFFVGLYQAEKRALYIPLLIDRGKRRPPLTLDLAGNGGFSGWVVRTGKPLWIDDLKEAQDLPVQPIPIGEPTRSVAVIPLVVKERVLGVFSVQSYEPRAFDPDQKRLLSDIANQIAIAIENARLYDETARRLAQAQVLREVMLAAASTLDFDQVLERTIQVLNQRMEVEYLCVALSDPGRQNGLRLHPAQIGYPTPAEEVFLWMDKSVCGRAFQSGKPVCVGDVREIPYYHEGAPEVRSELAVPIRIGDRVIGVLNVESREVDAFDEEDLTFYTAIAGQLGIALENARLYREERRRRQEAETLYRAVQALTTTLDLQEVLDRILTELRQVVPYDSASVQLLEGNVLKIIDGRGVPDLEALLGVVIDPRRGDNPNARVLESRTPLILEDAPAAYEAFRQPPHADIGIRAWMGVPLLFGDRVIGMLTLDKREPGFYTEEHARLAMAFAAQAAIAIENARLYRRLEEQSTQLARAVEELQDLDRLRNQLVQNVSHELRTPLTLIQGYAELLLSEGLGALSAAQRRALETMQNYIRTLSRLIYNLTALRTFPRETLALMPLSIAEVVQQVLEEEEQRARSAGVRFHTDFPEDLPPVLGDRERLDLVFYHLVDNAIKFSPEGGNVHIRAWADDEWVYVSVKDEGIGIAPEHLNRIFERFYQIDGSTTRRFGGMGVGLALVWEIVEAHGGTVEVESQPGQGSTFTVRLPQAEEVSS